MRRRKKRIFGASDRPRLVVYRSNRYMHAQIIDDSEQKVLIGITNKSKAASEALKKTKTKTEASKILGKILAEEALKKNIKAIVFDRNGYLYHGRVKSLAEGAREGGLEF